MRDEIIGKRTIRRDRYLLNVSLPYTFIPHPSSFILSIDSLCPLPVPYKSIFFTGIIMDDPRQPSINAREMPLDARSPDDGPQQASQRVFDALARIARGDLNFRIRDGRPALN